MTSFQKSLQASYEQDAVYYVRTLRHQNQAKVIIAGLLRSMPRSLRDMFRVDSFSTVGYTYSISKILLRLSPEGDLRDVRRHRIALGTIEKVSASLREQGWAIAPQRIKAAPGSRTLAIVVKGSKEIALANGKRLPWRRLRRTEVVPQNVTLAITFQNFPENDRCKLVEREVTIEAVPEHKEMELVVECDDAVEAISTS